ncbi:PREDICTED: homeobox protein 9-like isoform X2 [Papilio polytes]|uniref:homeobox protein 9-like isoform X2 n=1 Tax=Papilio polytes TaxID=76194 RepID=UPI000675C0F1|nr:PREDICTED: homeobox protein 9-like isoform X2 [Papilio polytes]
MRVHGTRAYIEPTPVPKMPAGLVELMEGLSREVLKNNPTEVYKFCAQHMRNLLVLRDGKPPEKYLTLEQKINKANNIIKRRANERRRNFDNNMQLHVDQDIIEQSFGNDVEIASIVLNADNMNTSTADSKSREENVDTTKYNIEDIHLDIERSIKDIRHNTTDDSVGNDNTETKNDLHTKDNTSDTYADSQNQGNSTGFDKDDKTNTEPAINDDNKKVVQELDINIENEINPIIVTANIEINDQPNVEVCEIIAEEYDVKEEKEIKLNEDPQGKSEEADQNNIQNIQGTNEQNLTVDGDNIKENIVISPLDSLKDSIANNETENYDIKANLHVKYAAVEDIKDAEKNDSTNILTEVRVTDSPAKDVNIAVLEKRDDTNKETVEVIEKPQNQTNTTETIEKDIEINNSNNTTENNATAKIITENDVSENENQEKDINTLIKEESNINKILNEQKDSDIVINIQSEQQDKDNKNDANSNDDSSQLSMKEFDDIESNNSNEPETDKLKNPKTMDLETAAITIQKVFRNFLFRSKTSSLEEPTNTEFNMFGREPSKDENSFTIQNQNKDRRVMGISRMDTVLQTVNEEKSLSLSTDDSSTISSAATVIQAHIRGFLCRNRLNRNKMTSSASLNTSKDSSPVSSEADPDLLKNKTVLNIHIVPEGGQFVSRDESILTSMELSLDGSPPTSAKLHPLGYDKSERRKQLKREDAIQSISPPSNNSRLSEEQDSVKEVIVDEVEVGKVEKINSEIFVKSEHVSDKQEQVKDVLNSNDKIETVNNVVEMEPADSQITVSNDDIFPNNGIKKNSSEEKLKDNKVSEEHELVNESSIEEDKIVIEKGNCDNVPADSHENIPIHNDGEIVKDENEAEQKLAKEVLIGKEETGQNLEPEQRVDSQKHDVDLKENAEDKVVTEISTDELDVVTPFTPTEENLNDSEKQRLLHSGEFHDVVLPTKVSRNDTSVVSGE